MKIIYTYSYEYVYIHKKIYSFFEYILDKKKRIHMNTFERKALAQSRTGQGLKPASYRRGNHDSLISISCAGLTASTLTSQLITLLW